ncbi:MAG: hypothetical protein Ct9H300mP16_10810 [Pseudomonadota bacterium]|nr:MAG: hypothetical protein Ct9H300mP16_10810 [Pseudomonadota bacterium]
METVSVIIPTFNRVQLLNRALRWVCSIRVPRYWRSLSLMTGPPTARQSGFQRLSLKRCW